MPKYLSNRVKRTPQSGLTSDRYQYLGLEQAEPNLGDPANPLPNVPTGSQFQVVSIREKPGERYWVPIGGGIKPGSITVREEGNVVPPGGVSSITTLNFRGDIITAVGSQVNGAPGTAVTITVAPPGSDKEVIFNNSGEFAGSSNFIWDTSNNRLGILTSSPDKAIHVGGDIQIDGTIYDNDEDGGSADQVLSKDTNNKLVWLDKSGITPGAGGTIKNVQYHNAAGNIDGAGNFVFDYTTNRVGIGTTIPSNILHVVGDPLIDGDTTFTGNVSIAGTLTYEDVKNVDSVGLITARTGIKVLAGGIEVQGGTSTLQETKLGDNIKLKFGNKTGGDLWISHTNVLSGQDDSEGNSILDGETWASYIKEDGAGPLVFKTNGGPGSGAYQFYDANWRALLKLHSGVNSRAILYADGKEKIRTIEEGIDVTGLTSTTDLRITGFVTSHMVPGGATGTYDLGTAGARWGTVYANTFDGSSLIDTSNLITQYLKVTGVSTFVGLSTFADGLIVHTGVSTFISNIDADGNLDVDGQTDLDVLNVSETATFSALVDINNNLDVDGRTDLDDLLVAGVSTFSSLVKMTNGGEASTFKVSDLTSGRVVLAGTNGELEDNANLTFNGQILNITGHTETDTFRASGISTFASQVNFDNPTNAGRDIQWQPTNDRLSWFDNTKATFGNGADLEITHTNDISLIRDIRTGVGGTLAIGADHLILRNKDGNEPYFEAFDNGKVVLYHDFFPKLQTTGIGVSITGITSTTDLKVTNKVDSHLIPKGVTGTYDIGTAGARWGTVYANTFDGTSLIDSTNIITEYLKVTGISTFVGNTYHLSSVGIGTTNIDSNTKLHIKDTTLTQIKQEATDSTGYSLLKFITSSGDGVKDKYMIGYNDGHSAQADELSLKNQTGDITFMAGGTATSDERLRITSDGKVGIGTASPSGNLEIAGTTHYQLILKDSNNSGNAAEAALAFKGSDNADLGLVGYNSWEHGDLKVQNSTSGKNIRFQTHNGTAIKQHMTLSSAGQLGIGTDHTPAADSKKLTVICDGVGDGIHIGNKENLYPAGSTGYSDIRFSFYDYLTGGYQAGGEAIIRGYSRNAYTNLRTTDLIFLTSSDDGDPSSGTATEKLRITSAGDVGIGTDAPSHLLNLYGAAPVLAIQANTTTGISSIHFSDVDGDKGKIRYDHTGNYLAFDVENGEKVRIESDGKVGIGTDNPETRLHVSDGHLASADNFDSNIVLAISKNTTTTSWAGLALNSGNAAGAFIHFGDTDDSNVGRLDYNHTDNCFKFFTNGSATETLNIASDGQVLITTDIDPQLEIRSLDSGQTSLIFNNSTTGSGAGSGLFIGLGADELGYLWHYEASSSLIFGTNNETHLTIDSDGHTFPKNTAENQDLGLSNKRWRTLYAQDIDITGSIDISGDANIDNLHVSGVATFLGNVSIGGTLTYEDVKNVDSVGLITARTGIKVLAGGIDVTGNSEFSSVVDFVDDLAIADTIRHIGDGDTKIRFPSNDTFTVETAGSERLRITKDGALEGQTAYAAVGINTFAKFTRTGGGGPHLEIGYNAVTTDYGYFGTGTSHGLGLRTNDTTALFIDTNQKVGIGTVTPTRELTIYSPDSGSTYINLTNATTGNTTSDGFGIGLGGDEDAKLWNYENTHMMFGTNNTERLRITSAGNVGIGTADPSQLLQIKRDANTTDSAYLSVVAGSGAANAGILLGDANKNNDGYVIYNNQFQYLALGTQDIERLRILSDGKVGIGITDPQNLLDLYQSSGNTTIGVKAYGGNDAQIDLIETGGTDIDFGETGAAGFRISYDGGDNRLYINSGSDTTVNTRVSIDRDSGQLGIGTDAPNYHLHVNGTSFTSYAGSYTGAPYTIGIHGLNAYNSGTAGAGIIFSGKTDSSGSVSALGVIAAIKENSTDGNNAGALVFMPRTNNQGSGANEKMRLTSSGELILGGHSSVIEPMTYTSHLEIHGTDYGAGINILRYSNDVKGPQIVLGKSRNGSIGSNSVVQSGDELGQIVFSGTDTNWEPGAAIIAHADEEWLTGGDNTDSPGRLSFWTTPNGLEDLEERMRITSSGDVGIGITNNIDLAADGSNTTILNCGIVTANEYYGTFKGTIDSSGLVASQMAITEDNADNKAYLNFTGSYTGNQALKANQKLVFDAGNTKLGIGTDSPDEILHIGQLGTGGNNYNEGRLKIGGLQGTGYGLLIGYDNRGSGRTNIVNANNAGSDANRINFGFGAITASGAPTNEVVTINQSGKVGIGTNIPRGAILHLESFGPIIRFTDSNASTNNRNWHIATNTDRTLRFQAIDDSNDNSGNGSGGGNLFDFYRSGNDIDEFRGVGAGVTWFVVNNDLQKVGIGTTNPDQTLELFKATGTNLVKVSTQANSTVGLEIEKTGSTTQSWRIVDGQTANGKLEFYDVTDSATRMIIDGSGNVGIATNNPSTLLDVWGANGAAQIRFVETNHTTNNRYGKVFEYAGNLYLQSRNDNNDGGFIFRGEDNSNTAEFVRIDSVGRVMIGNTQAANMGDANRLVIGDGGGNQGMTIYSGSSGSGIIAFADGTSDPSYREGQIIYDHGTNYMHFRTNGNTDRLIITSTGQLQATSASDVRLTLGSSGTAGTNDSVHIRADNADLKFMSASGGTTIFETNGTETLRITSAGDVGIGTNNPTGTDAITNNNTTLAVGIVTANTGYFKGNLTVDGTLSYEDVSNVDAVGLSTFNADIDLQDWIRHKGNITTKFGFPADNTIEFHTDGSERLRIDSSGNVGVNYTDTNSWGANFRVGGLLLSDQGSGNPYVFGKLASVQDFVIARSDTSGNLTERLRITSGGNLTLGTTVSNERVHIHTASSLKAQQQFTNTTTGTGAGDGLVIGITGGEDSIFWNQENTNMLFATNNAERLRITSDGIVRIKRTATTSLGNDSTYLGIGDDENGANSNRMIGFGYVQNVGDSVYPASMGYTETSNTSHTKGALVFNTRDTTSYNDVPTERLRINSSGYVGINTNVMSNSERFAVQLGNDELFELRSSTQELFQVWKEGTTQEARLNIKHDGSNRIHLRGNGESYFNGGNVGINTNNPSRQLHIVGNDGATGATLGNSDTQVVIDNKGGNGAIIEFLSDNNGAGRLMFTDTDGSNRGRIEYYHQGDYLRFDTDGSQRLTIDGSGHVYPNVDETQNLGTSTKRWDTVYAKDIDINGTIDVTGDVNIGDLYVTGVSTFVGETHHLSSVGIGTTNPDADLSLYHPTDGPILSFRRKYGNQTGDLGVIRFGNSNIDSNLVEIKAIQDGTTSSARLSFLTQTTSGATTERLRITKEGYVQVRYTNSATTGGAPLYVGVTGKDSITYGGGNDDTACLRIEDEGGSDNYYHGLELRTKRSGDVRLYAHDGGDNIADLVIATDNGGIEERMRIAYDGKVGIGTDDPGKTLDVWGNLQVKDANGKVGLLVDPAAGDFEVNQSVASWTNTDQDPVRILGWGWKSGTGNHMFMASGGNDATASQMALIISEGHGFKVGRSGWDGTDGDVSSTAEYLRITNSGTVNIGGNYTQTTYKASITTGNVNKKISFGDAAHNDLSNEGSGIFFSRQNDGSAELSGLFSHSNGGFGIATREDMTFHTGGGSTYGSAVERLRITGIGSVGINEDQPKALLHVATDNGQTLPEISASFPLIVTKNSNSGIAIIAKNDAKSILAFGDTDDADRGKIQYVHTSGTDVDSMQFLTAAAERLRITSAGDVGIGTDNPTGANAVTNNTKTLAVGNIVANDGTFKGNVNVEGTLTYEDVTNIDAVGLSTFQDGIHVIGGRESVGIGTTSVDAKLHIEATDGSNLFQLERKSGNDGKLTTTIGGADPCFNIVTTGISSDISIRPGAGDGLIGINKSIPWARVDIAGGGTTANRDVPLMVRSGDYGEDREHFRIGRLDTGNTANTYNDIRYHSWWSKNHATDSDNYVGLRVHKGTVGSDNTQQTEVIRFRGDGRVGIGTDLSGAGGKFQVFGTNTVLARFGNTINSTYEAISIKNTVASYPAVCNDSSSDTLDLRSMGSVQVTIDSNNNSTGKYFRVMNNGEGGAGTELFRVDDDGKVGINESSPQSLLDIHDSASANDTPEIRIESFRPAIRFADRSNSQASAEICGDNSMQFRISAESDNDTALTERLRITSTGEVNIGGNYTQTTYQMRVTGTVAATHFDSLSDLKLKSNVKQIENPIETVKKIDGVTFNWKEDNEASMGVIAQNVEKVIPELISKDEDDVRSVNYSGLIGLLIETVKEQQKQIDELKSRLDK